MDSEETDYECRVCRGNAEPPLRPLYSPCLCSGSIGLVHQDCLEAWLEHSRKDTCELCKLKYQFSPEYAEDTPAILPLRVVIKTAFEKILKNGVPWMFRLIAAVVVWLFAVPLTISQIYRTWIRRDENLILGILQRAGKDAVDGVIVVAVVVLTFVVAVTSLHYFLLFLPNHLISIVLPCMN